VSEQQHQESNGGGAEERTRRKRRRGEERGGRDGGGDRTENSRGAPAPLILHGITTVHVIYTTLYRKQPGPRT